MQSQGELLTPNVKDLQQDVIELLDQVKPLFERAADLMDFDQDYKDDYLNKAREILEARNKVDELELVMSIAAPMKSR